MLCSKCGKNKKASDFYYRWSDYYKSYVPNRPCKRCRCEDQAEYYTAHKKIELVARARIQREIEAASFPERLRLAGVFRERIRLSNSNYKCGRKKII